MPSAVFFCSYDANSACTAVIRASAAMRAESALALSATAPAATISDWDARASALTVAALIQEIAALSGHAAKGRRRLLADINSKLSSLGLTNIGEEEAKGDKRPDAYALVSEAVDDDCLCAHTHNFLRMAISRLERFDDL